MNDQQTDINPHHILVRFLPRAWWPYAALIRLDRPIGFYLGFLPALMGLNVAFIYLPKGEANIADWFSLFCVLFIGAWLMRSVGCIWNDYTDRELDGKVARSKQRPLAAGQITPHAALTMMVIMLFGALNMLWFLPFSVLWVALLIVPMVVIYPFMKRIFAAPQLWLGLTFNAGIWVAWVSVHGVENLMPPTLLYMGSIFWTLAYDTVYALQDREDDQKSGVRSLALTLGKHVYRGIVLFFGLCCVCWSLLTFRAYFHAYPHHFPENWELVFGIGALTFYISGWFYLSWQFSCWSRLQICSFRANYANIAFCVTNGLNTPTGQKFNHRRHGQFFRENALFGLIVASGWFVQIWM